MKTIVVLSFFILLATARPPEPWGPESGDVVEDSALVVTFVKNEPRLVMASPRHERHYDLLIPRVVFGDVEAHIADGHATAFFSSSEQDNTQLVLTSEAKHPFANTTLGCMMPGIRNNATIDPEDPLSDFSPMLSCVGHIYSQRLGREPVVTSLDIQISSRQRDHCLTGWTEGNGTAKVGVVLEREDREHVLRTLIESDAPHISIDHFQSGATIHLMWPDAIPAEGVRIAFQIHLQATTPRQVERDERVILGLLAIAFTSTVALYLGGALFKSIVLTTDQRLRNIERAVAQTHHNASHALIRRTHVDAQITRLGAVSRAREPNI